MTAADRVGHKRSGRTGRRALVALGAALCLLPFSAGTASAQSFIDPADPCIGTPPPANFADRDQIIPVHLDNVDCAVFRDIVLGVQEGPNRVYRPAQSVPRDQMASFIMRTLVAAGYELPPATDTGFSDVAADNVHAPAISMLKQIGVVKGTSATTYSPSTPVQRDQMASFLVRAAEFGYGSVDLQGAVVDEPTFVDVAPTNVHRQNIFVAVQLIGVAEGQSETMYNPNQATRRDQMASFVTRLLDVTLLPDLALERQAAAGE